MSKIIKNHKNENFLIINAEDCFQQQHIRDGISYVIKSPAIDRLAQYEDLGTVEQLKHIKTENAELKESLEIHKKALEFACDQINENDADITNPDTIYYKDFVKPLDYLSIAKKKLNEIKGEK